MPPKTSAPFSWVERKTRTSKSLPLIGDGWHKGVDVSAARDRTPGCTSCSLGSTVNTVCMPAYDVPGVSDPVGQRLLIVATSPTQLDDAEGEINPSGFVAQVIYEVSKHWPGPTRYAYAVSCASGRDVEDESIGACRPYLTGEIAAFKPDRILGVGDVSAKALIGHRVNLFGVRKAWGVVKGIPAMFVFNPNVTVHNRFASLWWKEDVKWALTQDPPETLQDTLIQVLDTPGAVQEYLSTLRPGEVTSVDCEWKGNIWKPDYELLCIGMCQDVAHPVVIPGDVAKASKDLLKGYFEDHKYPKQGHNFKEDRHAIWRGLGCDVNAADVDTLIWHRQKDSDSPAGLKALAWKVGWGGYAGDTKEDAEDEEGKKDYSRLEPDDLHQYNAKDIVVTHHVRKVLEPDMGAYLETWDQMLRPSQDALTQVERWGVRLSESNVTTYDRWLGQRVEELDQKIFQHGVPADFNPRSPKQLAKFLFEDLGVKPDPKRVSKKTKKPSLDREAMEAYKSQHPVIPLLVDRGYLAKQRSSFALGLLQFIGFDGRVHPSYRVVRSGRLSCKAPNLQQSPGPDTKPGDDDWEAKRHTDLGVWARGCWVPDSGNKLVSVDLKQNELRWIAAVSGDETMAAAFETGYDFHRMNAAMAYDLPPEQVTSGQRRDGKDLSFAISFGMDAGGLAASKGMPKAKAQKLLDGLLGRYRKMAQWQKAEIGRAMTSGQSFVSWKPTQEINWTHRRDLWRIGEMGRDQESEGHIRHARNVAINSPIQFLANCVGLASLAEIVQWIQKTRIPAKVVITVHDALVLEVREDLVEEVATKVANIMTSWPSGCVKLGVDVEAGTNWGELYKVKI